MGISNSLMMRDNFIAETLENIEGNKIFDENTDEIGLNEIIETLNNMYWNKKNNKRCKPEMLIAFIPPKWKKIIK